MSPVHMALRPQEPDEGRVGDSAWEPWEFYQQEPALTDMVTPCSVSSRNVASEISGGPRPCWPPMVTRSCDTTYPSAAVGTRFSIPPVQWYTDSTPRRLRSPTLGLAHCRYNRWLWRCWFTPTYGWFFPRSPLNRVLSWTGFVFSRLGDTSPCPEQSRWLRRLSSRNTG